MVRCPVVPTCNWMQPQGNRVIFPWWIGVRVPSFEKFQKNDFCYKNISLHCISWKVFKQGHSHTDPPHPKPWVTFLLSFSLINFFVTRGAGGGGRASGCGCHWPGRGCAGARVGGRGTLRGCTGPATRHGRHRRYRRHAATHAAGPPAAAGVVDRPPGGPPIGRPRGPQEHRGGVGHRRAARPRPVAGAFVWLVRARLGVHRGKGFARHCWALLPMPAP